MPRPVPGTTPHRTRSPADGLRGARMLALAAMLLAASAACQSSSPATLKGVAVTPSDLTLDPGETGQFIATGTFSDGTTRDLSAQVTWSVNDTGVATVDVLGLVTAVGKGTATLMAIDAGTGVGDKARVTVTAGAESLGVSPSVLTLEVGATTQLVATHTLSDGSTETATSDVTWASDDPAVATVSSVGVLSGAGTGSATISAALDGLEGSLDLTVHAPAAAPQSSDNVFVIAVTPVLTSAGGTVDVQVNIPSPAVSIGIIAVGTNDDYKFVEHNGLILGTGGNITGPGGAAPLSFNMINFGSGEEPTGDNLKNLEAEALFFPNDGTTPLLPAGTYTFPVGSVDPGTFFLNADTITPYVFYKTSAPDMQTMNVNLFVVEGVVAGATNAEEIAADPEVAGAIEVLRNVYEGGARLTLNVNVALVPNSNFAILESDAEQDALVSGYPLDAPGTALNLFVVSELANQPTGVIGYSLGIPGPFNLDGTIVSGTLAEYQGDGQGHILGFTLAHEFGHFLGLWHPSQTDLTQTDIVGHDPIADTPECTKDDLQLGGINKCPDRSNLMFPIVEDAVNPPITAMQATVIRLNPAVSLPLTGP